jgi:hypothetical protein
MQQQKVGGEGEWGGDAVFRVRCGIESWAAARSNMFKLPGHLIPKHYLTISD